MSAHVFALAGDTVAGNPALCNMRPAPRKAGSKIVHALRYLSLGLTVAHERRVLRGMTPEQLSDLGMRVGDVVSETRRSFWDLPKDRL